MGGCHSRSIPRQNGMNVVIRREDLYLVKLIAINRRVQWKSYPEVEGLLARAQLLLLEYGIEGSSADAHRQIA